ncbi:transposase [Nonomuraea muscovyensis]|uniref:transposase n=1 Tax=Nonomuraea muscovyensis TaxID=1124761 RepID=UPI00161C3B71
MARADLTDDERSLIEPHLPLGERRPIPDLRQQFNAVMWRIRTGSPWRRCARGVRAVAHGPVAGDDGRLRAVDADRDR